MSSIDATKCLLAGNKAWKDYIAQTIGVIDLTFADLRGADLQNLVLERCDFTGAQLQAANFDRTVFDSCTLNGANFSDASLVQCEIRNVEARNMIAINTVVRESVFARVDFTESNMSSATITSTVFRNCTFTNMHKDGLALSSCKLDDCALSALRLSRFRLQDCKMCGCSLSDWTITEIQIRDTIIETSTVTRFHAEVGSVVSSGFVGCSINEFCIGGANNLCQHLDFSRSMLARTDLRLIGLNSATMLNTALSCCSWPEQKGHVTTTGNYIPSPFLLAQPVQDLMGVDPLLRREIADAQYLVRKSETCGAFGRPVMRIWGLCTGFGQSLSRLSLLTFLLITAATIMLLAARNQLFGGNPDFQLLDNAARESFDAFFALADMPKAAKLAELIVSIGTHICGFVVLGFWVSILSTKLSRLGSE